MLQWEVSSFSSGVWNIQSSSFISQKNSITIIVIGFIVRNLHWQGPSPPLTRQRQLGSNNNNSQDLMGNSDKHHDNWRPPIVMKMWWTSKLYWHNGKMVTIQVQRISRKLLWSLDQIIFLRQRWRILNWRLNSMFDNVESARDDRLNIWGINESYRNVHFAWKIVWKWNLIVEMCDKYVINRLSRHCLKEKCWIQDISSKKLN